MEIKAYKNKLPLKQKVARCLWNFVWMMLFRPTPFWCCRSWRIFLLRFFGARIGSHCSIFPSCKVWAPWNLHLGDYVCLASHVDCYSVGPITINSKVSVSQRAFLCTASHDFKDPDNPLIYKPITIQSFAWVAASAFVGPGVTVGEGAVVGACAVVTKDVEAWTVVAGNPAKHIKDRVIRERENDEA